MLKLESKSEPSTEDKKTGISEIKLGGFIRIRCPGTHLRNRSRFYIP